MGKEKDNEEKLLEEMFDNAQFLTENFPRIAEVFAKVESSSPLFEAFKAGKETYEFDQVNKNKSPFSQRFDKNHIRDLFNEKSKQEDKKIDQEPEK